MQTPSIHADAAAAAIVEANRLASEGRSNLVRSEVAMVRADVAASQQQINATWHDAADGLAVAHGRMNATDNQVNALRAEVADLRRLVQQMMSTRASTSTSTEHTRDEQGSGCAHAR